MPARLYSLTLSHPSQAARLMLERKRVEHTVVNIVPGFQPLVVRLVGFRRITVPALRIDARRIQGSREISRFLDDLVPDPPLFPAESGRRTAVKEAERWGEETLQPVPRRLFRWGASRRQYIREWIAAEVVGLPVPGLLAQLNAPVAHQFARMSDASDDAVRRDLAALPDLLAHADTLIADGTIGGDEPGAADFQIATSVRVLLAFEDLRPLIQDHAVCDLARRILPDYPDPIPAFLPPAWLPPSRPTVDQLASL
jgi:glutathione S-transferase